MKIRKFKSTKIDTVDQLIKRLEAGEVMTLTGNSSSLSCELVRACEHDVKGDVAISAVNELLSQLPSTLRIFTCMFPGCGAARYLGSVNNQDALRYEIDIRWVNRPNDPVTFD